MKITTQRRNKKVKQNFDIEKPKQLKKIIDHRSETDNQSDTRGIIDASEKINVQLQQTEMFNKTLQHVKKEEEIPKQNKSNKTGLPDGIKQKMETAFNSDFSDVKVHSNSSKAPEVGALAYTQGNNIHFAPGQFNPDTSAGQKLIGHELTHVQQQREGRVKPTTEIAGMPVNDNPALEKEADILGEKAVK